MATKKDDPGYSQLAGHIPKDLARQFRILCSTKELKISKGLEEAIQAWVSELEPKTAMPTTEKAAQNRTQINILDLQKLADQLEIPSDRLLKAIKEIKLEVINGVH